MVGGGKETTTVLWNGLQWLLVLTMSLLTKVISIIDLKVTGSGLVGCMSGFCSSFLNLSHGCLVVYLKVLQMYSWHMYVCTGKCLQKNLILLFTIRCEQFWSIPFKVVNTEPFSSVLVSQ